MGPFYKKITCDKFGNLSISTKTALNNQIQSSMKIYTGWFLDALASLKTKLDIKLVMFSIFQDYRVLQSVTKCFRVLQSVKEC